MPEHFPPVSSHPMHGDLRQIPSVAIFPTEEETQKKAATIAGQLNIPCIAAPSEHYEFILFVSRQGLQLQWSTEPCQKPLTYNFANESLSYRRHYGGGVHEPLAKAVGIRKNIRPFVFDATAGMGRDGFLLASLGCHVLMAERNPIVALLLQDAMTKAMDIAELAPIVSGRMALYHGACQKITPTAINPVPSVLYLDPMYPHRTKSALVKKEMRLLRRLVGDDEDAAGLLEWALRQNFSRIVVKRPKGALPVAGIAPQWIIRSKAHRFDIYKPSAGSSTLSRSSSQNKNIISWPPHGRLSHIEIFSPGAD